MPDHLATTPTISDQLTRNQLSVLSLHKFLQEIVRNPSDFSANSALIDALKSQGALSKWSDDGRSIFATSLNTVKRIADQLLDGGFSAIDEARIAAQNAIKADERRQIQPNTQTKAGLRIRISDTDEQLQQSLQDLWHVTSALSKALLLWHRCAELSGSPSAISLCDREQKEIRARLSLCTLPVARNVLAQDETA